MSTLFLIRHGQASFGADDYDVLSQLGVLQSARLGEYFANGVHPRLDAMYTGPRRRQVDTAAHLRNGARAAGVELPRAEVVDELDEYPAFELVRHWMSLAGRERPDLTRELAGAGAGARQLEPIFEDVLGQWASGELNPDHIESFQSFVARVGRGIVAICAAQGRGKRVAVVTSGGPIAVAMKMALCLPDMTTLRVAWVVANSSLSEFRYRESEFTMVGFNATPHLTDRALITYR